VFLSTSLLPWNLAKCDWDVGLEISFLEATLVLRAEFGSTLEGSSFAGHTARLVTDLTLTSEMKGMFRLCFTLQTSTGWLRVAMVERWSLTGELSLSCTRPAADG